MPGSTDHTVGVVGAGTIGLGLAGLLASLGSVRVAVRSASTQARARRALASPSASGVEVVRVVEELAGCAVVFEAVGEDISAKSHVLQALDSVLASDAILLSTTSSLSAETLAEASGRPARFAVFHPFNPVERMALVELCFPRAATPAVRERVVELAVGLGKEPVIVPDVPGFVVNRLLFPFLFDAVRLLEQTELSPAAIDACLTRGAGHPMGPLALLDLVGLDVAVAIGDALGLEPPPTLRRLVASGALGRKSGRGVLDSIPEPRTEAPLVGGLPGLHIESSGGKPPSPSS